ncbi:MAG: phosphoribosyltransferase [Rhizobiaceae bacterium]|nr:phosphoribosyltransferase [Rhizobiaceae bacterium]
MFQNRSEAGRLLAVEIAALHLDQPVVMALPRGGVPVACEIAAAIGAPLDLAIVRKVGAPGNRELALAAIVDGDPPEVVLNQEIADYFDLSGERLKARIAQELPELERRSAVYRRICPAQPLAGKSVILVDDGAATGATMKVVARAVRRRQAALVVAALPVAPPDAIAALLPEVERIVCLDQPQHFRALSLCYREFDQLEDSEVLDLLRRFANG